MELSNARYHVWIIMVAAIITRLPQLFSPHLVLDGDECVLGLMAKHFYEGKEIPLFFWGQNYGFSLIEELFILPFYAVGGVASISVKMAMLSLWIIGVIFFYKMLLHVTRQNATLSLLITLLLVLSPTWAVWSMKARGGYLTAFTLSWIVLYISFHSHIAAKWWVAILSGVLLVLIFHSQPLWLAGLLPLVVYSIWKNGNRKNILLFVLAIICMSLLFYFLKSGLSQFYNPDIFTSHIPDPVSHLTRIIPSLYENLHGKYYLFERFEPGIAASVFAWIFTIGTILLILRGLFLFIKQRTGNGLMIASVLSIVFTLSYTVIMPWFGPRVLLPVLGYILFALAIYLRDIQLNKLYHTAFCIVFLFGMVSLYSFRDYRFSRTTESGLTEALQTLQQQDIQYTYCTDGLLAWQIMFYSKEKVLSRHYGYPGRYPEYIIQIDDALQNNNNRTAVFTYKDASYGLDIANVEYINDYLLARHPTRQMLLRNFEFGMKDSR